MPNASDTTSMSGPPMCVHGNAIDPTSSGSGSIAYARPRPPAINPPSECITHFGAAVVPDVEYSQRTASPSVGGAGNDEGSPSGRPPF